jgi:hypothetical protein
MLLGFLDELHRFTAEDVEKVVNDLANEGYITPPPTPMAAQPIQQSMPVPVQAPAIVNGDTDYAALTTRLERLEKIVEQQDKSLGQAARAAYDFLRLLGRQWEETSAEEKTS